MCRVLDVSVSGYYQWTQRSESNRSIETRKVKEAIGIDQKELCIKPDNSYEDNQIVLRHKTNSINISRVQSDSSRFDFYGVSLERKDASGVIYHTIGVNGAEFASYNKSPLFWEQIGELNAYCYIISLGQMKLRTKISKLRILFYK